MTDLDPAKEYTRVLNELAAENMSLLDENAKLQKLYNNAQNCLNDQLDINVKLHKALEFSRGKLEDIAENIVAGFDARWLCIHALKKISEILGEK